MYISCYSAGNVYCYELKLTDLTSVRQREGEPVFEYIKRFKEIRKHCCNLSISDKDLTDIVFDGLRSFIKEKIEGYLLVFLSPASN